MKSTLKGDSKLEELIFYLNDDHFIKEDYEKDFQKYQKKLEEFFHFFLEILVEFKWQFTETHQDNESGIDVCNIKYFTFVGSKKIEFISVEEWKNDETMLLRLMICIKDCCNRTLFSIYHVYDYDNYTENVVPRKCGKEIYNFRYVLPTIMNKLEYNQGQ